MEMTLEQQTVINDIINDFGNHGYGSYHFDRNTFSRTVVGYAGTGKTTLIAELRKEISKKYPKLQVAFLTLTGKASGVLASKLTDSDALGKYDYVGTIHGLIYVPETRYDPILKTNVIVKWVKRERDAIYHDLFIIDEASMISKDLWEDLNYYDKTTIYVGDHGQLPPIGDQFNILCKSHYQLKTIHRQAMNSPIIKLSKFIREEGYIPPNTFFSNSVFKLSWNSKYTKQIWNEKLNFDDDIIILCAFNTTRANTNDKIRERMDYKDILPIPGEKIVCLQNNHELKIMNGQIGTLLWVMPVGEDLFRMTVEFGGKLIETLVSNKCFGQVTYTMYEKIKESKKLQRQLDMAKQQKFARIDYFDYGYCTSVHKSQGSEWDKVVLIEQRTKRWDDEYFARWLYTGVTRAREKLFIINDYWG